MNYVLWYHVIISGHDPQICNQNVFVEFVIFNVFLEFGHHFEPVRILLTVHMKEKTTGFCQLISFWNFSNSIQVCYIFLDFWITFTVMYEKAFVNVWILLCGVSPVWYLQRPTQSNNIMSQTLKCPNSPWNKHIIS